ncbi:MAG TPA: gamma-glutamyl-gamma-aminobutyrate hydrolase family protein [Dehalococcoidia bacterium]|nr:gamma-glutamyl-gamma-aminobutyrate hydrolase family protein [Dehalococcoidia bacterium]
MGPVIGIPLWRAPAGERFRHYEESVRRAGGRPLRLTQDMGLGGVHGLLITGGVDVDPALYGERPHPRTQRPNRGRDEHELALLREALDRGLPLLGVCRGHQLLNVALGGSLLQHIEGGSHQADEDGASAWHLLRLSAGGLLWELYGRDEVWANSRHHQAVTPERLAPGLRVLALSPDGMVEAVQVEGHPWAVGVQWHPERPEMWGEGPRPEGPIAEAAPLFAAFIAACRSR